jgi:hypothetical protein
MPEPISRKIVRVYKARLGTQRITEVRETALLKKKEKNKLFGG